MGLVEVLGELLGVLGGLLGSLGGPKEPPKEQKACVPYNRRYFQGSVGGPGGHPGGGLARYSASQRFAAGPWVSLCFQALCMKNQCKNKVSEQW